MSKDARANEVKEERAREKKFKRLMGMDVYDLLNYLGGELDDHKDFPMDVSHKEVMSHIVNKHHEDMLGLWEAHLETAVDGRDYSKDHLD